MAGRLVRWVAGLAAATTLLVMLWAVLGLFLGVTWKVAMWVIEL